PVVHRAGHHGVQGDDLGDEARGAHHVDPGLVDVLVALAVTAGPPHQDAVALLGRATQGVQDQPGQGVVVLPLGQLHTGDLGSLVEPEPGGQLPPAPGAHGAGGLLDVVLVPDVADDLLGDVLE